MRCEPHPGHQPDTIHTGSECPDIPLKNVLARTGEHLRRPAFEQSAFHIIDFDRFLICPWKIERNRCQPAPLTPWVRPWRLHSQNGYRRRHLWPDPCHAWGIIADRKHIDLVYRFHKAPARPVCRPRHQPLRTSGDQFIVLYGKYLMNRKLVLWVD